MVGFGTHQVYSGTGAGVVMESITLKSPLRSKPQSGSVNWGTTCKTEGSELSISRKPPHKYAACYRFLPVTLE